MKSRIFTIIFMFLLVFNLSAKEKECRITLNLKQVDIHDVLMSIAKGTNHNIVIPPKISGNITILLDNVTLENALKVITNLAGYSYYIKDNIIFIDKKENVTKIKGSENIKEKVFYLNYAKASSLKDRITGLLSKEGKVIIDERTNNILVQDFISNIKKVENFLKIIDNPTKQVMIEAKIVVINKDASKELGIQWGGSYVDRISSSNFFYGIKGGSGESTANTTGTTTTSSSLENDYPGVSNITTAVPRGVVSSTNLNEVSISPGYVVNLPTQSSPAGSLGLIFGKWGYYNLSVKLTALKSKNLAKVISSPKVLVLNNEKASISQGIEIPYKSVSDAGTETQFKDAKLKLEVTPHISTNGTITLEISLNKDSLGKIAVNGEPAINTQEISTKLSVKDGAMVVIGGILENSLTKGETKVPLFGDIPIFGGLFRNSVKKSSNWELLIFITPKIVKQ